MAQEWAKAFYNSANWQRLRRAYIASRILIDGGTCEECGKEPGEIVHHKIILTQENIKNFDISLNRDNLEFVCKECHDRFEGHGFHGHGKISALCIFDESGQPVSTREIDHLESVGTIPPG
jgi:5-methylcytosine-specific restriction endonuclease McrA